MTKRAMAMAAEAMATADADINKCFFLSEVN